MKKIKILILCGFVLLGVCGCSNGNYYCDSNEHELRGTTCVIKEKIDAQHRYFCKSSDYSELRGDRCYGKDFFGTSLSVAASSEFYCTQGVLDDSGIYCIIEKTYNAKAK